MVVPLRAEDASGAPALTAEATSVEVVNETTARLTATVHPKRATTVWYEYGPTTAYGSRTADAEVGDQLVDVGRLVGVKIRATLTRLAPGTEYHVRLVAQDNQAVVRGPDTRFVTPLSATPAPATPLPLPVPVPPLPLPLPVGGDEPVPGTTPAPPAKAPGEAPAAPAAPATPEAPEAPADAPEAAVTTPELPPAPAKGTAVVAAPVAGEVRVKIPGTGEYRALADLASVPVGSIVDARAGKISLASETGRGTQTGQFWGAVFQVRQDRSGKGMTELHLKGGSFAGCRRSGEKTVARAAGKRRKPVRALWGKDKGGRFRTHGRDSVATVRGTTWKVVDRCDGTLTRVTEGAVSVRDRHTGRRTLVRAGERHFARHR